ncbi:MAG: VTT domain-containing protein [Nitrospiraceae bacterium]|nr:VTT domain-containing protein [Nitrospiraceae bacterium]
MTTLTAHFPYLGFFIILVLGGLGFPFPEGVTLIICGFLIGAKIVEPFIMFFVVYLGVLTGDFLSFYIGRKYGRSILSSRRFKKILSPAKISTFERKFDKFEIPFMLLAGRLISGVFLVAGIIGISRQKFLIVDAISAFVAIIIWLGIGYVGGSSFRVIRTGIVRIEHVAALLLIILTIALVLYVYFRTRGHGDMKSQALKQH